jgi:hypothetical protein
MRRIAGMPEPNAVGTAGSETPIGEASFLLPGPDDREGAGAAARLAAVTNGQTGGT